MIVFQCHSCGYRREVPDEYAGKTAKCPQCQALVLVGSSLSRPAPPAEKHSIAEFLKKTGPTTSGRSQFEMEGEYLLQVSLNGGLWTKMGSMVAYTGSIKFTREKAFEHGLKRFFKRTFTGEGAKLTKADGQGFLYLADQGKKISLLNLEGESLYVNGNDLIAFQEGIQWDIKLMRKVAGMLAGGLFNVRLEGRGIVAVSTHHDPLSLEVRPDRAIFTDPNATVAWSGSLSPDLKTDISFRTFLGRGSGESLQMKFTGSGFVVIQPFEEKYFQSR